MLEIIKNSPPLPRSSSTNITKLNSYYIVHQTINKKCSSEKFVLIFWSKINQKAILYKSLKKEVIFKMSHVKCDFE